MTPQLTHKLGSGQVEFVPLGRSPKLHRGPQAFPGLGTLVWMRGSGHPADLLGNPVWVPRATLDLKTSKFLSSGHQAGLGPWWLSGESKWQASSLELNLPLEQNTYKGLKEGLSKRPGLHIRALIWSEAAPRNAPRELLLWSPTSLGDVWTVTFLYINHTDFLRGSLQLLYSPFPSHFSVSRLHLESFITSLLRVWRPLACLPAWGLA